MKRLTLLLCFLAMPTLAYSQTHYCDTTPATSGTGTVGVPMTIQACAGANDVNGTPVTITAWTLYDGAASTPITMAKGSTSAVSGKSVYSGAFTPATAGSHALAITATGNSKESAKSVSFLLSVLPPPAAPPAPTNLTAQ